MEHLCSSFRLLYWVEAKGGMQKIGVMDWEGRNQDVILREEDQLPQPYAISVSTTVGLFLKIWLSQSYIRSCTIFVT